MATETDCYTITVTHDQWQLDFDFLHINNNKSLRVEHSSTGVCSKGDVLMSVNGICVANTCSVSALQLFQAQRVPFTATFVRRNSNQHSVVHEDWPLTIDITENAKIYLDDTMDEMQRHYQVGSESTITPLSDLDTHSEHEPQQRPHVHFLFDSIVQPKQHSDSNSEQCLMVSSIGVQTGIHEWSIKILQCRDNPHKQEVGIVEKFQDIDIDVERGGIRESDQFGARAVYANNDECSYYASCNDDGTVRCYKSLTHRAPAWREGDIIGIRLNLSVGNIKFYLNGKPVRKVMSVQKGKRYHPIIACSNGQCQYGLVRHFYSV
eukprot:CAMPEP_0197027234 /NCGR_PEP_ID=MMETSP1384-20130603/7184_1 /TAXON_ID=29189 /ORGANISM="Ammonia sp." /LENGTH=320 /DNA_ID=CAMNT_0042456047 /DNA_START=81 /DNA_END=1043 /DNA_ORIENTATION=-